MIRRLHRTVVAGKPTFSCLMPVAAVGRRPVRTIESTGTASMTPSRKAFVDRKRPVRLLHQLE